MWERKFHGTKVPESESTWERKFHNSVVSSVILITEAVGSFDQPSGKHNRFLPQWWVYMYCDFTVMRINAVTFISIPGGHSLRLVENRGGGVLFRM